MAEWFRNDATCSGNWPFDFDFSESANVPWLLEVIYTLAILNLGSFPTDIHTHTQNKTCLSKYVCACECASVHIPGARVEGREQLVGLGSPPVFVLEIELRPLGLEASPLTTDLSCPPLIHFLNGDACTPEHSQLQTVTELCSRVWFSLSGVCLHGSGGSTSRSWFFCLFSLPLPSLLSQIVAAFLKGVYCGDLILE